MIDYEVSEFLSQDNAKPVIDAGYFSEAIKAGYIKEAIEAGHLDTVINHIGVDELFKLDEYGNRKYLKIFEDTYFLAFLKTGYIDYAIDKEYISFGEVLDISKGKYLILESLKTHSIIYQIKELDERIESLRDRIKSSNFSTIKNITLGE